MKGNSKGKKRKKPKVNLTVRITDKQRLKLKYAAEQGEVYISEVVCGLIDDYVPDPPEGWNPDEDDQEG